YDPNVDINELKKLILCYKLDGITTKNKFRINGNWGMTGIFYDQEGYYYKYPTFECEFRKPIIETECKELFIEEKNLTFTVSSLEGGSTYVINKKINYDLHFKITH
ncbi:MAG: hypothetical protein PHV06_06540, partial [bacterium]|nr:hypothetical protein [bacterium]